MQKAGVMPSRIMDRKRLFHIVLRHITDTAAGFLPGTGKGKGGKSRVLVVRPDGIGDFVLFTDALRGIRKLYPPETHEITLVANVTLGKIASELALMDVVILIDRQLFMENLIYRWKLMRRFRRTGYDFAFNPVFSRVAIIDDAIVRVTKAPVRIAWEGNLDNMSKKVKWYTDRWYKKLVPNSENTLMELTRNAQFVRGIGLAEFKASLPVIHVAENWKESADKLLQENRISRTYYIILPGTGLPAERAWPADRYGELARLIVKRGMGDILVCGGEGDRSLGRQIVETSGSGQVFDLTGKTTLETLAVIMSEAEAVIGSDTGGIHLAAAVGGKAISITGGAFPGRFFPYQVESDVWDRSEIKKIGNHAPIVVKSAVQCECPNWSCIRSDWSGGTFPCISEIGVDDVFRKLTEIYDLRVSSVPQEP
jgi:ADP-heptose:LPS heptosyltransferase